jgi:hypothetical protein
MQTLGRLATSLALSLAAAGCAGGTASVLHAKGLPKGDGPARMEVKNSSGVSIQKLFVAKTEAVDRARTKGVAPDSAEDAAVFGDDQLGNAALVHGHTLPALELPAGSYDVIVVDPDQREQLVKALRLQAGGRYTLEIGSKWSQAR